MLLLRWRGEALSRTEVALGGVAMIAKGAQRQRRLDNDLETPKERDDVAIDVVAVDGSVVATMDAHGCRFELRLYCPRVLECVRE